MSENNHNENLYGVAVEPIIDRQNPISACDMLSVHASPANSIIRISTYAMTGSLVEAFNEKYQQAQTEKKSVRLDWPATAVIQMTEERAIELIIKIADNLMNGDIKHKLSVEALHQLQNSTKTFLDYLSKE